VRRTPAWCNAIIRVLHIILHASEKTIIFFLGYKNYSILFLYILVIVCGNLTSNAVVFRGIAGRPLLVNVYNDYRI